MCPRIGGRRDRPSSPRTLLLQLSGLEDILSSVLDLREDRAGRTATHGRAQSTSQAGHEMNSLLSQPELYPSPGARFVHPRAELPVAVNATASRTVPWPSGSTFAVVCLPA